jgi:ribosomal protein S3
LGHELVLHKGTEFYSANWILYNLQQKLQARNSNIKRAMQELFDRAALLLDQKVLKGLTIKMSGRLSGRKQGMAKTVSKTIGVLPLSGLKQTVDYDQGFVTTKLGCLGIKVWVFY